MYPVIYSELAKHGRMSVRELARRINLSETALYNKLHGKSAFKINEMFSIQKELGGVPLDELFTQANEIPKA